MYRSYFILILCIVYVVCESVPEMENEDKRLSPEDPSSFARPDISAVTHMHFLWDIDFEKKILTGKINYTAVKVVENASELILDIKDLKIHNIHSNDTPLSYDIGKNVPTFGQKLTIHLPKSIAKTFPLTIEYESKPDASGLVWLTAQQTLDKKFPFLFSHSEAIHSRSFFPCQDTPAVKTPYNASVTVPKQITVLMSAIQTTSKHTPSSTTYEFEQKIPVPSYLVAIAAGLLESRKIGPRSHVWAEPGLIDKAKYEFEETETMLKTAEDICGPYVWKIYDLLVLPPSFSFGGMENPCLTFVTPTLIAGDRSLVLVVAHEIAHSWTGNLVTNKNFEHFWLNEGFTVFIERKIAGRMKGSAVQDFEATTGINTLNETVNKLGVTNPLTMLVPDLNGVNPDDSFSSVPYEKGSIFLRYLENLVGGPEKFEPFLRKYLDKFKYKSLDSDEFKKEFNTYFAANEDIEQVDWETWYKQPGMPPVIPDYDKTLIENCTALKNKWVEWDESEDGSEIFSKKDIANMSANQMAYFLRLVMESDPLPVSKLEVMDSVYHLNDTKNYEIKYIWIRIGLKAHWEDIIEQALKLVTDVGRMKYIRPIYQDLYKWEQTRQLAIDTFEKNKKSMMYVSMYTVSKDLHLVI